MPCYGGDTVEGAVLWRGHCRGCRVMEWTLQRVPCYGGGHFRGFRVMEGTL